MRDYIVKEGTPIVYTLEGSNWCKLVSNTFKVMCFKDREIMLSKRTIFNTNSLGLSKGFAKEIGNMIEKNLIKGL